MSLPTEKRTVACWFWCEWCPPSLVASSLAHKQSTPLLSEQEVNREKQLGKREHVVVVVLLSLPQLRRLYASASSKNILLRTY